MNQQSQKQTQRGDSTMKSRILKALAVGAVLGVVYEYVVTPYITAPIAKKVEDL